MPRSIDVKTILDKGGLVQMSYENTKLSLDKDCIFIQLEKSGDTEPRSVVYRHKEKQQQNQTYPINHYTPLNHSARMVLDLLTHNKSDAGKGIAFEDIIIHLVRQFQVTVDEAKAYLNEFLYELDKVYSLLEVKGGSDHWDDKHYPPPPNRPKHEARGRIVEGGTLICCGYVINWYRP